MTELLYTFTGATTAVNYYLKTSSEPVTDSALAAAAKLQSVSEQLLSATAGDTSDEKFKEFFDLHLSEVLESIDTIRASPAHQKFDSTLVHLLEYFYHAADTLMGNNSSHMAFVTSGSFFL